MLRASRHAVLIPSYNSGRLLLSTVAEALSVWPDIIVVIDGSTDGSENALSLLAAAHSGLHIVKLARNRGKGAAVRSGAVRAAALGFSHILTMDADGQHPAEAIAAFVEQSRAHPAAMILGVPVFGPDAPALRVWGRKISNVLAAMETRRAVVDCLFGFRVYPLKDMLAVMTSSRFMTSFDFDPELAVRLSWQGVPVLNVPTNVRYLSTAQGGISHFHYGRDNIRLGFMHLRLFMTWVWYRCRGTLPPSS